METKHETEITRLSDAWDLCGDILVHHRHGARSPRQLDPRTIPDGHTTEIVHHGMASDPSIILLLDADAEPEMVIAEMRRLAAAVPAAPQPIADIIVAWTPNGREIRQETGEDGETMFAVQPQNDNYWVTAPTIRDAMLAAGWATEIAELYID